MAYLADARDDWITYRALWRVAGGGWRVAAKAVAAAGPGSPWRPAHRRL
ncbi:hypothetical protein ABID95_007925 [Streptomyces atratus]